MPTAHSMLAGRFGAEPELALPAAYLTSDADALVTELQVPVTT